MCQGISKTVSSCHQKLGMGRRAVSLATPEDLIHSDTMFRLLGSRTGRQYVCSDLSHSVYGTLSEQPQKEETWEMWEERAGTEAEVPGTQWQPASRIRRKKTSCRVHTVDIVTVPTSRFYFLSRESAIQYHKNIKTSLNKLHEKKALHIFWCTI